MKRTIESALRFVNLATTGMVAGSLGFGRSPLVPGWQGELPPGKLFDARVKEIGYLDSIGPIAVISSIALTIGSSRTTASGRVLDLLSTVGSAGVIAMTTLGTVRINRKLDQDQPVDYASEESYSLAQSWNRTHLARRVLGLGSFLCAAAASAYQKANP